MDEVKQAYQERMISAGADHSAVRKKILAIAITRMAVFLAGVVFLILWFNRDATVFVVLAALSLPAFLGLMQYHAKLFRRKTYLTHFQTINRNELDFLSGAYHHAPDGQSFLSPDHAYAADLDLFGKGSLYQYLNRTATDAGSALLAQWLGQKATREEILDRQQAVQELSGMLDWRQDFQVTGLTYPEKQQDSRDIRNWLNSAPLFYRHRYYEVITLISPIVTVATVIGAFFFLPYQIPAVMIIGQLGLIGYHLKTVNKLHQEATYFSAMMTKYARLISQVEEVSWTSKRMQALRNLFIDDSGIPGSKAIGRLSFLLNALDNRLNWFAGTILNGLFLWDIRIMIRLEKWKEEHCTVFTIWEQALVEVDALQTLGCFDFNHPSFVYPVLMDSPPIIRAEKVAHPLLDPDERVYNDISIDGFGQFMLITGSNMAGKSTYLRAIGVNMVLAMAGAKVCAGTFECIPMPIFTSMRIGDSIQNRESTFYAELKRLRSLIASGKQEKQFILLDEILKGTNSRDKLLGSITLIEQLISYQCAGLIATHDLALGDLEKEHPENIRNFCFEVEIKDDKFEFDYKLKRGICQIQNATQLMKNMGIAVEGREV